MLLDNVAPAAADAASGAEAAAVADGPDAEAANETNASRCLRALYAIADAAMAPSKDGGQPWIDGGRIELGRPVLGLTLQRCAPSWWRRFHAYHYKTQVLSTVATTFLLEARATHAGYGVARIGKGL